MQVDKVIVRTILTTLAAIGVLVLFTIAGLCAFFPSTSMEITYDMGMERSAIHFAERAYKGTEDVYFIAYATEVAIEEADASKIVDCGEKFIEDDNFEQYSKAKGENYEQFIYGKVCVSKYECGDKNGAVELACKSLKGRFPQNNALVAVLLTSLRENDIATVETIKTKLKGISVEGDEAVYLQNVLMMLDD